MRKRITSCFAAKSSSKHKPTFDRSSLTRWRQRTGEEKLVALIQESLAAASSTGAAKPTDFSEVIVDTTVQQRAVAFPTDAKLVHRARERLVRLAKKAGVELRQSYERVGKRALIAHQRYAHTANRTLRTIPTYLGRVVRDIGRKIRGEAELESVFSHPLTLARRVREQRGHPRGKKVYSLHAPDVEFIGKGKGKGKAHRPTIAPTSSGSRFRSPRRCTARGADSSSPRPKRCWAIHTLATVIPEMESQLRANLTRIAADHGCRGHHHTFKAYISGQRRRVTEPIKRDMRRRSAVEPVIGHATAEHRMGRNHLAETEGDAANAVLAAAGNNFRRLLEWLRLLLCIFLAALEAESAAYQSAANSAWNASHPILSTRSPTFALAKGSAVTDRSSEGSPRERRVRPRPW